MLFWVNEERPYAASRIAILQPVVPLRRRTPAKFGTTNTEWWLVENDCGAKSNARSCSSCRIPIRRLKFVRMRIVFRNNYIFKLPETLNDGGNLSIRKMLEHLANKA